MEIQPTKNLVSYGDCITILFLALLTNIFSEFLSWLFIYRRKKYKELKKLIDTLTKKIENAKDLLRGKTKTTDKKLKNQESDLKNYNMEMVKVIIILKQVRMMSTFIVGIFVVFFLSLFNSIYLVIYKLIKGCHRGQTPF